MMCERPPAGCAGSPPVSGGEWPDRSDVMSPWHRGTAGAAGRGSLTRHPAIGGVIIVLLLAAAPLSAKVFDRTTEIAGMTLHYKIALPKDFDPAKTYPAVLAFPPGSQDMNMVLTTLVQNWLPEADHRGYIVVIPA